MRQVGEYSRVEEQVRERNMSGKEGQDEVKRECCNGKNLRQFCLGPPLGGFRRE